jgi:hypothetical protein
MAEIFFRPSFLTLVLFIVLYAAYSHVKRNQRIPKGLPWSHKDERIKSAGSVPERLQRLKEVVCIALHIEKCQICINMKFSVLRQRHTIHLQRHRTGSNRNPTTVRDQLGHHSTRISSLCSGDASRAATV